MHRISLPLAMLLLALPAPLPGQTRTTIAAFASADDALGAARVGGSLARETGILGYRVGAAADVLTAGAGSPTGWAADVDATAHAGALLRPLEGLRLVTGLGAKQAGDTRLYLSLGGAYAHPLAGPLALDTEVRYRTPLMPQHEPVLEFRLGVSLGFSRAARRPSLPPGAAPRPLAAMPVRPSAPATAVAARVIDTGETYLGVRYQWGGNTPDEGFDCSGFLRYIFRMHGVELPRVSRDQARFGQQLPLDLDRLQPGDLLFFAGNGKDVDHAAVYVGGGRILHSSASGRGVRYDDLYSARGRYYRTHLVAARRVLGDDAVWTLGAR